MKFSIITVCYNSAATIERTIRSVAAQRGVEIEHIVIDGASSDGTQDIIRRHASVSQFISEPDSGIYDAMNKGLARATGDIVAFLNADDVYASADVLERVAAQFSQNNIDAVMGDVGFFRENNDNLVVRRYDSSRFSPSKLGWGWMPAHPAFFLTRTLYLKAGAFKTDYRIAGDYEFIARLFSNHAVRYIHYPEILAHMQMGGISNANFRSRIRLNREVIRACRENGIHTNWLKILSKYPLKMREWFRA